MKKKMIALACASAISIGMAGVSVSANEVEQTSGSYVYGVDEVSVRGAEVTEKVGGGTWKHRSWIEGQTKHCTSKYHHPTKKHSAFAKVGPKEQTRVANKGDWANAKAQAKYGYKAIAKWNNDVK